MAGNGRGGDEVWAITPPAGQHVDVDAWPSYDVGDNIELFVEEDTCRTGACVGSSTRAGANAEHVDFVADGGAYHHWTDRRSGCVQNHNRQAGCPQPCDPATEGFRQVS